MWRTTKLANGRQSAVKFCFGLIHQPTIYPPGHTDGRINVFNVEVGAKVRKLSATFR